MIAPIVRVSFIIQINQIFLKASQYQLQRATPILRMSRTAEKLQATLKK